jgi:hypothetical protein
MYCEEGLIFSVFCFIEYCNTLCCKKKEKIEPQPQPRPKRVEMYYEEPDDSVVEVRKLAIPRFYEEPVVVRYVWLINDGC